MQRAPPALDTRNLAPLQTPKILEFLVCESGNYVPSGLGYPDSILKAQQQTMLVQPKNGQASCHKAFLEGASLFRRHLKGGLLNMMGQFEEYLRHKL